jgi:hypothetical protein
MGSVCVGATLAHKNSAVYTALFSNYQKSFAEFFAPAKNKI